MASLRGWAPRGERLKAKVPHGRWKTMTFLAALRHDRIEAPWLLDGPINGESFRLYVEKVLVPTLRPGDIVILDNLGSHRGKAVRRAIRAAGAKLFFLPKYSPDLNPIEQLFAKLKHFLRKAAARTADTVYDTILCRPKLPSQRPPPSSVSSIRGGGAARHGHGGGGRILAMVTPQECRNYFAEAGYERRRRSRARRHAD